MDGDTDGESSDSEHMPPGLLFTGDSRRKPDKYPLDCGHTFRFYRRNVAGAKEALMQEKVRHAAKCPQCNVVRTSHTTLMQRSHAVLVGSKKALDTTK